MSSKPEFNFGDNKVAKGYDTVLVPLMFDPWAEALLDMREDWQGATVVDVAAGTGIVSEKLSSRVGDSGRVISTDINPEMLNVARHRCDGMSNVEFQVTPAEPLALESDSVDVVTCQQGFQFFPDKNAAAKEMRRVLKDGGEVLLSTWCPVEECTFFGLICTALEEMKMDELSGMMRVPFDHMPAEDIVSAFKDAGFSNVSVVKETRPLMMPGGKEQAAEMLYASPIAPMIREMSDEDQDILKGVLNRLASQYEGTGSMGDLVSHVLRAS